LNLSDAELIELIKSHGIERRSVMKALGVGAALSFGVGNAAGEGFDPEIDERYGYTTPDADAIPDGFPDHEVELHIAPPEEGEHGPLFHFSPTGLHVEKDDVVQFTFTTPDHTITVYHPEHGFQRRIPGGATPFSSPVGNLGPPPSPTTPPSPGAWLYKFRTEGLYDMYCAPHHILGMNMRIVVGDLEEEDVPGYEDTFEGSKNPPLLPPFSKEMLESELENFSEPGKNVRAHWVWLTPQEVLDTESLDPENIQDEGEVSFDAVIEDIDRIDGGHGH